MGMVSKTELSESKRVLVAGRAIEDANSEDVVIAKVEEVLEGAKTNL